MMCFSQMKTVVSPWAVSICLRLLSWLHLIYVPFVCRPDLLLLDGKNFIVTWVKSLIFANVKESMFYPHKMQCCNPHNSLQRPLRSVLV